MNFIRKPIFHDRQNIEVNTDPFLTTTINTFVDVPGASLIAKDLGESGTYLIWIGMKLNSSNNNSEVVFRGMINGSPTIEERPVPFGPSQGGVAKQAELHGFSDDVPEGATVQLQWKVDVGTATMEKLSFSIDGIPGSRVLE